MSKLMLNPDFNLYERNGQAFCSSRIEDLPKESASGGYVYIVDLGDRIKIGKSKNVKRRLREIRQLSGSEIKRFCVSPECGNYHQIEHGLHSEFKDLSILGEWFNLDFDKAASSLNQYDFQAVEDGYQVAEDFDIEVAANNHLKTVLDENPVIKNYLEENGLRIFYCKETSEILVSDGEGYETEFKAFMQLFISYQHGRSR